MADNLIFKDAEAAFEYVKKYYVHLKIQKMKTFIGLVKSVDQSDSGSPDVYSVEITCLEGVVLKHKIQKTVAGVLHPELNKSVKAGDLILWGASKTNLKVPAGFILEKLSLELDVITSNFLPEKETGMIQSASKKSQGKTQKHDLASMYLRVDEQDQALTKEQEEIVQKLLSQKKEI